MKLHHILLSATLIVLSQAVPNPAIAAASCSSSDGKQVCSCSVKCVSSEGTCGCQDGLGQPSPNIKDVFVPRSDGSNVRLKLMLEEAKLEGKGAQKREMK